MGNCGGKVFGATSLEFLFCNPDLDIIRPRPERRDWPHTVRQFNPILELIPYLVGESAAGAHRALVFASPTETPLHSPRGDSYVETMKRGFAVHDV